LIIIALIVSVIDFYYCHWEYNRVCPFPITGTKMTFHMWRLNEAGEDNFGLACTEDGLVLGRTPLIERRDQQFVVRERSDIERLLRRAYETEAPIERIMPGLATVARALNADDQCLARIAAVHLRIPDLPNVFARSDMEAEDRLIKYARDEGGDTDWDPAKHPRAGTPPNPGWFAPTDGAGDESSPTRTVANEDPKQRPDASPAAGDNWVRLPPGPKRIDELADFLEWLANATPQDEQKIRAEIKRYFCDVGWQFACDELNRKLTDVLKPGVTKDMRQQILNGIQTFALADPAEVVRNQGWATDLAIGGGAIASAAEAWRSGWAARGRYFEERLGRTLHPNFRTIDKIPGGAATSIKSIDLNAPTYQKPAQLAYRLNKYIDEVAQFKGGQLGGDEVKPSEIKGRALSLAIPKGSITPEQQEVIEAARARAKRLGVDFIITEF
jgi:hypothetical protein